MRNLTKSLSSLDGQPDGKALIERTISEDEAEVSSKSASASYEQSFCVHFKQTDFSTSTRGFSQSDHSCRAEPCMTWLLSMHTFSDSQFIT